MLLKPNKNIIAKQLDAVYMRLRSDVIIFIALLAFIGLGIIVSIIGWALENNLI
jgi:hypothetical protein